MGDPLTTASLSGGCVPRLLCLWGACPGHGGGPMFTGWTSILSSVCDSVLLGNWLVQGCRR